MQENNVESSKLRPATAAPISKVGRQKAKQVEEIENDIDDLDDLLGGKDSQNEFGQTLDEHDFFGSSKNFEESNPRKKRGKNDKDFNDDDPLAFLQRAKYEKEQVAHKKAMMEAEIQANFKKPEELEYNLLCPYMENEDKWRKYLGQDLYKQNNLNVTPQMR